MSAALFRLYLADLCRSALAQTSSKEQAAKLVVGALTPVDCIEAMGLLLPRCIEDLALQGGGHDGPQSQH